MIPMSDGKNVKILFDQQTTMPLFYPLRYSMDYLNIRSPSTQEASLQAIKYFYDYWLVKYNVTFCFSFHESNHDPAIAIAELDNYFKYLSNGHSYSPSLIIFNPTPSSSIHTNAERVRAVGRFIKYLVSKYVTAYYCADAPKEIIRHADRLLRLLKTKTEGFSSLSTQKKVGQGDTHQGFKSLTPEMVAAVYKIITPSSIKKENELNPFLSRNSQFRNFLIVRVLLNYGLRVSELMLLELESIKSSVKGDKYSLVIAPSSDDNHDPRSRLPSIKTANAHRVIEIEKEDYAFLQLYINKIRPKADNVFIFTTLREQFKPLSYDAIYLLFAKIDKVFTEHFPYFKNTSYFDSIVSLTPHVARHTWAYLTLERIYIERYEKILRLSSKGYTDFSNNGIMDDSISDLRELAGWSYDSPMPMRYAKRFISKRANESNLKRIGLEKEKNGLNNYFQELLDDL